MPTLRRLLSIEDNPVDAWLIRTSFAALARTRPATAFEVLVAPTLAEGLALLRRHDPQVVLLDLHLPDARGAEAVARLREARPDVPILILTGQDDEELAQRLLQAGAQDYLVKGRLDMQILDRVVLHAIERQRLACALAQAHARELERRDEFLAHVSHELRTPLTAIEQFGSILEDGLLGPVDARQAEGLSVVRRNARALRRMVDDLLDVARLQGGRFPVRRAPVDLAPVVRRTLSDLAPRVHAKGLSLQCRLLARDRAHADELRVGQVLANLVDNAIKFTPRGGTLTVELRDDPDHAGHLRLTVSDTGCGIAAHELPRLFERLAQVDAAPDGESRRGLGLGLHICREIVTRHGGTLWAESRPGTGSRFHVSLPAWSLERLLPPLLDGRRGADEPFQIVSVQLGPPVAGGHYPGPWPAADETILRCAEEATAIVLPQDGGTGRRLLLRGTTVAARAFAQRLRRRLAQRLGVATTSATVEIRRTVLGAPPAHAGPAAVAALLSRLERDRAPQRRQASGMNRTMTA